MKISDPRVLTRLLKTYRHSILSIALFTSSGLSHALVISDLYLSEIMANPQAVSDSNGEWFELYNPTAEAFSFNGLILSDNGSDYHLIDTSDALTIQPGDYFVFGRNGDSNSNGGYNPDYVYDHFLLANGDDEIILSDLLGNSLQISYEAGFVSSGQSMELTDPQMLISDYQLSTVFSYGAGDFGSPGTAGSTQLPASAVAEPSSIYLLIIALGGYYLLARNKAFCGNRIDLNQFGKKLLSTKQLAS
ncbi:MAG: lamin tail domain-containing protein [Gammaproteobacteria bacterium]|nr:lamin tail domain-containing protein [Gammaproteobacteria bacterium]